MAKKTRKVWVVAWLAGGDEGRTGETPAEGGMTGAIHKRKECYRRHALGLIRQKS